MGRGMATPVLGIRRLVQQTPAQGLRKARAKVRAKAAFLQRFNPDLLSWSPQVGARPEPLIYIVHRARPELVLLARSFDLHLHTYIST